MPPSTLNSEEPEKGIDVMCTLALVRLARSGSYDVVTLASRDTDLALPLMKHTNYRPQRLKRQSGTTPPTGERSEI